MNAYPLLLEPILKPKVWGGDRLRRLGKPVEPGAKIGESWEVADLPPEVEDGQSVIANGPLRERTLHDAIEEHRDAIMGRQSLSAGGRFPLLIKYLDARENLSVQVHPDEAYAAAHPEAHLKSEAWYVVDAAPGAVIYKGLREELTRETFAERIRTGRVVDDLQPVEVHPGDCHYLPSGTCHALGAGVLVAEVQTPSDTTFRIYDWGRTDRELHVEQALECTRLGPADPMPASARPIESHGFLTRPRCTTEFFTMEEITADGSEPLEIVVHASPEVWMVLSGGGRVVTEGADDAVFGPGTTLLMPGRINHAAARFDKETRWLRVSLPAILRGMIA